MEIVAKSKHVRVSPRKIRVMAAAVKKLPLESALVELSKLRKSGAGPLLAALNSAVANAQNNAKLDRNSLKIKNITIDEGMRMKRRDKSHGQRYGGGMILKKTSHITVTLTD